MFRSSDRGDYSFSVQQQLRDCMYFFSANLVRVFIILGTSFECKVDKLHVKVCVGRNHLHVFLSFMLTSTQEEDLCSTLENTSIFNVWYW